MTRKAGKADSSDVREARLKAALRANLTRRKAQGRARAGDQDDQPDHEQQDDGGQGQGDPAGRTRDNED